MQEEGKKFDNGKLRFDLMPVDSLMELAGVYTYGAAKYDDRNWERGIAWSRVFAAMMRHAWAFWSGEDNDPESGLPHMAHAAWCCMALIHYAHFNRELDDRKNGKQTDEKALLELAQEVLTKPPSFHHARVVQEDIPGIHQDKRHGTRKDTRDKSRPSPKYMTAQEVADMLGCSDKTIYYYTVSEKEKFPSYLYRGFRYYTQDAVIQWVFNKARRERGKRNFWREIAKTMSFRTERGGC